MDYQAPIEDVCKMITSSIKADLEKIIKRQLLEDVDPLISKIAEQLAESTVACVRGYYKHGAFDSVQLHLTVNHSPAKNEST